ncbi:MAG: ATP-grasp domain-containing protein [Bacteriovoracia bacterium]
MALRSLKIVVLFDFAAAPPADHDYSTYWQDPEWRTERNVVQTLRALGHQIHLFGIHDTVDPLLEFLRAERPDLVFNLCEAFAGDREHEAKLVAMLELLGIPITGSSSVALSLCKDKALTKKIIAHHDVCVPRFAVSSPERPLRKLPDLNTLTFPVLVKPLGLEASEGIAQGSLAQSAAAALARARHLHRKYGVDVIVEEYIVGREIYVSVIGDQVLPPRELVFSKMPSDRPRFATYHAKWDEAYRRRWGIQTRPLRGVDKEVLDRIFDVATEAYRALGITGYARMDFRLNDSGELYFIEANPNPSIAREDDFARSAAAGGLDYPALLGKIIELAL